MQSSIPDTRHNHIATVSCFSFNLNAFGNNYKSHTMSKLNNVTNNILAFCIMVEVTNKGPIKFEFINRQVNYMTE